MDDDMGQDSQMQLINKKASMQVGRQPQVMERQKS